MYAYKLHPQQNQVILDFLIGTETFTSKNIPFRSQHF